MLLAVDVGNTHMVIGVFENNSLRCHWRVKTDKSSTIDELASLFHGLFVMENILFKEISSVIISSVVPVMQAAWTQFSTRYLNTTPMVVGNGLETGIEICIDNPGEVGADRIVNAVAAYSEFKTALIIIDFGTAITWDCVSTKGEYLGGIIAPGLSISMEALGSRTAKLPQVDISTPPTKVIGTNTVTAIKSGILFGYGSMVDGLVKKIKEELEPDIPHTIATGGMAKLIAPYAKSINHVDPMLTLKGLHILHERNK